MRTVYLEKCNPAQNVMRFYRIMVTPTLFGGWAVMREWGRIGQDGQMRAMWFERETAALEAATAIRRKKEQRGYRSLNLCSQCHPHQRQ